MLSGSQHFIEETDMSRSSWPRGPSQVGSQRRPTPRALTSLIWASGLVSAAHALSSAGISQIEADVSSQRR